MTNDERREKERLRHRIAKRKMAAEKAISEGREPNLDFDRPKVPLLTEDQKRDHRRLNAAKWRAENTERSREIVRESEKRRAAARAIAEGREPGKAGRAKQFTEEEKRAKRKAKSEKWNAEHIDEVREKARIREAAKRAVTFVSRAFARLTDEEKRLVNVAWSATRRDRARTNGGRFTKDDILRLLTEQEGTCAMCALPFVEDGYHIDHRVPLVLGGTNYPDNLQLLHPACNLKKGKAHPDELAAPTPVTRTKRKV